MRSPILFPIVVLAPLAPGPAGSPMPPTSRYQPSQDLPQSIYTLLPLLFPPIPPRPFTSLPFAITNDPRPLSHQRHSPIPSGSPRGQNMPLDLSVSHRPPHPTTILLRVVQPLEPRSASRVCSPIQLEALIVSCCRWMSYPSPYVCVSSGSRMRVIQIKRSKPCAKPGIQRTSRPSSLHVPAKPSVPSPNRLPHSPNALPLLLRSRPGFRRCLLPATRNSPPPSRPRATRRPPRRQADASHIRRRPMDPPGAT